MSLTYRPKDQSPWQLPREDASWLLQLHHYQACGLNSTFLSPCSYIYKADLAYLKFLCHRSAQARLEVHLKKEEKSCILVEYLKRKKVISGKNKFCNSLHRLTTRNPSFYSMTLPFIGRRKSLFFFAPRRGSHATATTLKNEFSVEYATIQHFKRVPETGFFHIDSKG